MANVQKVLVANRGEIAVRVIRACDELGLPTVAVYSTPDRGALHARMAGEAFELPGERAGDTYNHVERLVDVATRAGAWAVHPGYGFRAEDPRFARAVLDAGLVFVGPRPETLELLGDKVRSQEAARAAGLPVLPESARVETLEAAQAAAAEVGFPVMIKSPLGGGGHGCQVARTAEALDEAYQIASSQGRTLYGSGVVFLQRYVAAARHVEVQTVGDGAGRVQAVGERECSVQRRRQKVVEEAPPQNLPDGLRAALREAAVSLMASLRLQSAATVEFLVEGERFWFLEVNPRIQVEHPVTELVYGVDLVRTQMDVALGRGLTLPDRLEPRGYAVEARIYAEEPRGHMPRPGHVDYLRLPAGPGVRVDTGVEQGDEITALYDPLVAKLVVWAEDKPRALARLRCALRRFAVNGSLETNLALLRAVAESPWFASGRYDTTTLETTELDLAVPEEIRELAARAVAAFRQPARAPGAVRGTRSSWGGPTWGEGL